MFVKQIPWEPESPQFQRKAVLELPSDQQRRENDGVEGRMGRRVCWTSGSSLSGQLPFFLEVQDWGSPSTAPPLPLPSLNTCKSWGRVAQEGGVTGIFKAVSQQKPTQLCKAIILQLKKDSLSKKYQQVHMPPEAGRGERQWGDGRGVVQGGSGCTKNFEGQARAFEGGGACRQMVMGAPKRREGSQLFPLTPAHLTWPVR